VKTVSEMTYTVSGGALNSTQFNPQSVTAHITSASPRRHPSVPGLSPVGLYMSVAGVVTTSSASDDVFQRQRLAAVVCCWYWSWWTHCSLYSAVRISAVWNCRLGILWE